MLQLNNGSRLLITSAVLVSTLAFGVDATTTVQPAATASTSQEAGAPRFVRAKDGGTKLFNLADKTSLVVGTVPPKGLLEVYGERAGYLSVDAPAGLDVWVYGQYLRATQVPGIVEVTGDGVFMRPLPKSDESSYPLQQQLHKGDRLAVVGRGDPKKALSEDWVRVVSPPGTHAWVVADDTSPIDAKEDVHAEWSAAVKSSVAARPTFDLTAGGAAATAGPAKAAGPIGAKDTSQPESPKGARPTPAAAKTEGSFDTAERLYEAARTSSNPDWSGVRAAYQSYLDKSPDGTFAAQARVQLQKVELHQEIERIKAEGSKSEADRGPRLAEAQRRLAEANQSQDPLWGRFQARGWIAREQPVAADAPRFVVYWAGKPMAEIVCSSGRYDLSKFAQFEVGVTGTVLRAAVAGSESVAARPARIDATRIEVLGARNATH